MSSGENIYSLVNRAEGNDLKFQYGQILNGDLQDRVHVTVYSKAHRMGFVKAYQHIGGKE